MVVKFEVKLPGTNGLWNVSVFICNSKANLDELCLFDVPSYVLIFVLLFRVLGVSPVNAYSWELGILQLFEVYHSDYVESLTELHHFLYLLLEIISPDVLNRTIRHRQQRLHCPFVFVFINIAILSDLRLYHVCFSALECVI